MNVQKIATAYQPLFDLLLNEHGITLLHEDMDEIIYVSDIVKQRLYNLEREMYTEIKKNNLKYPTKK